ncbi:hypothetical protein B0H11DRAFT_2380380 [Mycena galericulata]|nr:hypothetical protein B0H11DRAFT_2380380 [Mycena galericulata]
MDHWTSRPGIDPINLNTQTFADVGINNITDTNGKQDLRFITACGETYGLHVVGGEKLYTAAEMDTHMSAFGAVIKEKLSHAGIISVNASVVAYVNGGFYNRHNPKFPNSTASENAPEWATIGMTRTSDGARIPFIAPPKSYADVYAIIRLSGQAVVTGAPVIARDGKPTFTEQDMAEERFRYDPENITPGLLNHAEHPNPRTAIIVPTFPGRYANYRLVTAFTTTRMRGAEGTGFTMVE